MELEESAMVADPNVEARLNHLREEEKILLDRQTLIEAGNTDDIAALEHQDLMRLNQLQQRELKKRQAAIAKRLARANETEEGAEAGGEAGAEAGAWAMAAALPTLRREGPRRRICTVRVNNLHAATTGADAIETDV